MRTLDSEFAVPLSPCPQTNALHFFSVDGDVGYEPFFADFGPLNLAGLKKFCDTLTGKLNVRPPLRN